MTDIATIEAALAAATPGPWHAEGMGGIQMDGISDGYRIGAENVHRLAQLFATNTDRVTRNADACLIANAPTWIAELLARVEAAEALLELTGLDEVEELISLVEGHARGWQDAYNEEFDKRRALEADARRYRAIRDAVTPSTALTLAYDKDADGNPVVRLSHGLRRITAGSVDEAVEKMGEGQ